TVGPAVPDVSEPRPAQPDLPVTHSATPRRRATSSRVRNWSSPWMVALTRLIGLVLPCTLVRMLVIPQAWSTSRTPGPAFTPVPGPAGTRITLLAPYLPITRCGMVLPRSEIFLVRWMLPSPSLIAFSTDGGTSLALPYP